MDERRSRHARARAELALLRLAHQLRDDDAFFVVLGGLVPEVLSQQDAQISQHLGTTDVDMLLITHIHPDRHLRSVEDALQRLQFEPDPAADGWRWHGPVDGVEVELEFLCDLPDHREHEAIRPPGCSKLAAANLRGTGYVAHDFAWEQLTGTLTDGTEVRVNVRFAGLEGYLLSKCVVARTRAAAKDYYDLVYVLMNNRAGGPEQAARALLDGELATELRVLRSTFLEIGARFTSTTDAGPLAYTEQAIEVEPDANEALLRADAVDIVRRFIETISQ
ncbi:MAG: hypothetical protein ACYCUM_12825 [Solirubrobacteraceae bacterium]